MLVLGCIAANFRNQIFVGILNRKLLTRSIKFTYFFSSPIAKTQRNFVPTLFKIEHAFFLILFKFRHGFKKYLRRCSRKCRETLQILEISRLQFDFHNCSTDTGSLFHSIFDVTRNKELNVSFAIVYRSDTLVG